MRVGDWTTHKGFPAYCLKVYAEDSVALQVFSPLEYFGWYVYAGKLE